jgi:hypothetical protein
VGDGDLVVERDFKDVSVVAGDEAKLGLAVMDLPVVAGAVVGARHLDNLLTSCEGAGGAHREHGGLAAGVGEAHHLQRRDALAQQLHELERVGAGGVVSGAARQLVSDRLSDGGVGVTKN